MLNFEKVDVSILIKIRKCFEQSIESNFQSSHPINLILDKDLNILPFESFPIFNKFSFKRTPILSFKESKFEEEEKVLKSVFYIVNPSGDLYKTQERFEEIFKQQPNWEGVIGRKPTVDEFFNGICGQFDLFIYFGHSSGETYAPLKELSSKRALKQKKAPSALLIGCSSGKVKSNGIFPAESAIFHYLKNER